MQKKKKIERVQIRYERVNNIRAHLPQTHRELTFRRLLGMKDTQGESLVSDTELKGYTWPLVQQRIDQIMNLPQPGSCTCSLE